MTHGTQDSAGRRHAVEAEPESAQLESWRENFGRTILRLDVDPAPGQPFRCRMALQSMPGVAFASVSTSACRTARTPRLVKEAGRDDIGLVALVEGMAIVSQRGRDAQISAGEAIFLRNDEPGIVDFPTAARFFSFALPSESFTRLVSIDSSMTVVPAASAALRLALRYAELLLDDGHHLLTTETYHAVASHFHELAAAMIGITRDSTVEGRGMRAARLRAIKADIAASLSDHQLSIARIAERHGITPRYVGKLFEGEGTTFSQYVLEQRLSRVRQMLSEPRFAHHLVSTIAIDTGFGDISHFNRSFRRRFGTTPTEARRTAQRAWNSAAEEVFRRARLC